MASGDLISRVYSNFRGVDFRGEEINLVRSPNSLNIWKDYKETESIRTRPEMELLHSFNEKVYGIFFYNDMMIVHSGKKLYKVVNGTKTELYSGKYEDLSDGGKRLIRGINPAPSNAFVYNNVWYFKDGVNYLQYDGTTIGDVVGHIPTTSESRTPAGSGKLLEDVNMLSDYRINTFMGDGKSTKFYVDVTDITDIFNIKSSGIETEYTLADALMDIKQNGAVVQINGADADKSGYTWSIDYATGCFTITPAPPLPLTDGQDNVKIRFMKLVDGYADRIRKCTILQVFDSRVFFSGNPDFPNMVWHCSLNDPTYCSDSDCYSEGLDNAKVKGVVAGNNALWVFKEPSQANTTVFYHTPTIDADYGKVYSPQHSSIATGCVGKAINFNDDIVFFSDRGMEGISGDVTTEQVIAHRSSLVDRKLITERNYKEMLLEEWEGYLLTFIDNKVYLADSRAVFTNEDHIEYEYFYWELSKKITCTRVNKGVLYLGTDDGVYSLTDNTSDVESYWVTPKDKFKHPQYMKTTNKRGCVVEAIGDISVFAKIEDTDFELIGDYKNITDYFVSRIKRKKFKDIQLKFYSKKRFSLETATLECFIGGYLKR
ncbi:MAG: hypothetical protein IKU66_05230 [Clostridia bacterium]|nr:hypothetical protein [Clostridia bacterium]